MPKRKKTQTPKVSLEERINKIKTVALVALVSDTSLMERLVLKGGSSLDLVHGVSDRPSIDIDFSMEGDFPDAERAQLQERFEQLLAKAFGDAKLVGDTFDGETLEVFDVAFNRRPGIIDAELESFWGGYELTFKLILPSLARKFEGNVEQRRKHAVEIDSVHHKTFTIEISRFEYCEKQSASVEGYTVYTYPPGLVVAEKLRAICQQMPDYRKIVHSMRASPRARDFVDIFNIVERFRVDVKSSYMTNAVQKVFAAKRVPLHLLSKIQETKTFHEADFAMIKSTAKNPERLRPFDEYFAFVVTLAESLKALWDEQPPSG